MIDALSLESLSAFINATLHPIAENMTISTIRFSESCSMDWTLFGEMSADEDYAFACTHWALGSLVLVGLAASEYSGAGTIVALPIAAVAINLSGKLIS